MWNTGKDTYYHSNVRNWNNTTWLKATKSPISLHKVKTVLLNFYSDSEWESAHERCEISFKKSWIETMKIYSSKYHRKTMPSRQHTWSIWWRFLFFLHSLYISWFSSAWGFDSVDSGGSRGGTRGPKRPELGLVFSSNITLKNPLRANKVSVAKTAATGVLLVLFFACCTKPIQRMTLSGRTVMQYVNG